MAYTNMANGQPSIGTTTDSSAGAGTANTVSTFAGAVYATDSAAILGDFHQIAQRLITIEAAMKTAGIAIT